MQDDSEHKLPRNSCFSHGMWPDRDHAISEMYFEWVFLFLSDYGAVSNLWCTFFLWTAGMYYPKVITSKYETELILSHSPSSMAICINCAIFILSFRYTVVYHLHYILFLISIDGVLIVVLHEILTYKQFSIHFHGSNYNMFLRLTCF